MRSNGREEVVEVFDALSTDLDQALDLDLEALTPRECLALLRRCEILRRRLPALEHPMLNQLAATDPTESGGKARWVLADELRITREEAGRRITQAAELGPHRSLPGQPLPPLLPAVATAQRHATIGPAHITVIRSFFSYLPEGIDAGTLAQAEHHLSELAGEHRQKTWLLPPRLPDTGLPLRSPPRPRLRHHRPHRHHRPDSALRPPPPTAIQRLAHPQTPRRHHPNPAPTSPRPRPAQDKHVPSPRKAAAPQRRRRRGSIANNWATRSLANALTHRRQAGRPAGR